MDGPQARGKGGDFVYRTFRNQRLTTGDMRAQAHLGRIALDLNGTRDVVAAARAVRSRSNPVALLQIAAFAKELDVSNGICATPGERNDVIEAQSLPRVAFHAPTAVPLPHFTLHRARYRFASRLDRLGLGH